MKSLILSTQQKIQFKKQLLEITSLPTAPFKEQIILKYCKEQLQKTRFPFYEDQHGNLVLGANSQASLIKKLKALKTPAPFFIAHTDHPGFHITQALNSNTFEWKWFGGSPSQGIVKSKIYLADQDSVFAQGHITQAHLNSSKTALTHGQLKITKYLRQSTSSPTTWFGAWHFKKPSWYQNNILYTQHADDIASVSLILALAKSSLVKKPFFALLSRGEEVGFIGTIAFFKKSKLPLTLLQQKLLAVSLETSRVLPGATHGKGPIIRLGDRRFVFSSGETQALLNLAQKVLPNQHQQRIMDGGSCEASVTISLKIPTIAVTLPLGNYHNQRLEGGPESKKTPLSPAPEFIHSKDYLNAILLAQEIINQSEVFKDPCKSFHQSLDELYRNYKPLLKP